jgi:hypothetical protein
MARSFVWLHVWSTRGAVKIQNSTSLTIQRQRHSTHRRLLCGGQEKVFLYGLCSSIFARSISPWRKRAVVLYRRSKMGN